MSGPATGVPRVFLVDDHAMVRSGVRAELGSAAEVVGEAADVPEAVAGIRATGPDVVLLDVHLPGGGGRAVLEQLRAELPGVRWLALSVSDAAEDVIAVIRAGARGYVRHDDRIDVVERAMVKARAGEAAVSPQLLCEAFGALLRPRSGQHAEGARIAALLTEREAEVLARIVDGEDTRRIAAGLGVATSTARTHVQRLLTKLGAATRLEAAALAVRTGVLDHLPGGPAAGSAG